MILRLNTAVLLVACVLLALLMVVTNASSHEFDNIDNDDAILSLVSELALSEEDDISPASDSSAQWSGTRVKHEEWYVFNIVIYISDIMELNGWRTVNC